MPLDPDQCAAPRSAINKKAMISHLLRRDIIVVLSIKLSIVLISAFCVFGPRQRPHIDINALQDRILNNSDR
jgi:hypothetical protein